MNDSTIKAKNHNLKKKPFVLYNLKLKQER